jgi:hypothetical protein
MEKNKSNNYLAINAKKPSLSLLIPVNLMIEDEMTVNDFKAKLQLILTKKLHLKD